MFAPANNFHASKSLKPTTCLFIASFNMEEDEDKDLADALKVAGISHLRENFITQKVNK